MAKLKRCQNAECGQEFVPARMGQKVCSPKCGLAVKNLCEKAAQRAINKRNMIRRMEAKEKVKTKGAHLREAQAWFNMYIRLRDDDLPCISCGRYHNGKYDAGHYRSVGACPELRFDEDNVHKQCVPCNQHLSGNAIEYRIRLVQKIGLERVERLESKHKPLNLSIDQIKELKSKFMADAKRLKKGKGK